MIGQDLLEGIKDYLDGCIAETVYIEGGDDTLDRPAVILRVDNWEPHEFIRNNYDCTLTVELETIPADMTRAAHLTLARKLEQALYSHPALSAAVEDKLYGLHDVWTSPAELGERDGLRTAEWTLRMVLVRGGDVSSSAGVHYIAPDTYLPLAGGTMTGAIAGQTGIEIAAGGIPATTINTLQMTTNGGFQINGDTTADNASMLQQANQCAFMAVGSFTQFTFNQDVIIATGKTVQYSDDVDWTAVTHNTGWVDVGSPYQTGRYCKRQGVVYVEGYSNRSSGSATKIFTLPAGCRPAAQLAFKTNNNLASDYLAQVSVEANGDVSTQTGEVYVGITFNFYAG